MIGAAKATNEKAKRRLEKSEFVEAEAQESDDDEMFGFAGRKKDDGEEEDGDDLDKTLDTLVDDQEMDEETVNAELVHKKYQWVVVSF
jgi:mediator of replication checkpoint protein 1